MHELALAEAAVAIAEERCGGRRVARVALRVGRLRHVVPDALAFGFDLAALGTAAEGAELVVEEVPARVRCRGCGAEAEVESFPLACPECGSLDLTVTEGEQFEVDATALTVPRLRERATAYRVLGRLVRAAVPVPDPEPPPPPDAPPDPIPPRPSPEPEPPAPL